MQRKMMGLLAALVAFAAFALVPAISSAHGLLDTENVQTTTVGLGKRIVGYNDVGTSTKFIASGLTVECSETTLTGTVHANPHTDDGAVLGTIEHAYFRGSESETKCKSSLGAATITVPALTQAVGGTSHWCLRTIPTTNNFVVDPRNCTEPSGGEFTFLLHAGGVTCGYKRTASLTGDFTTPGEHKAATWTLDENQEMTKHVGGILCPAVGKLAEFKFEMYTDTTSSTPGTWRDATNTADPIWVT